MLEKRIKKYYSGKNVSDYEQVRGKQKTWHIENKIVPEVIKKHVKKKQTIIDLPCGTGRWLDVFDELQLDSLMIDISDDMLKVAKKKALKFSNAKFKFLPLDVFSSTTTLPTADILVMTRFLNLISFSKFCFVLDKALKAGIKKYIFTVRLRCGDGLKIDQLKTHIHIGIKNLATILNIRKKSLYHLYDRNNFFNLLKKRDLIVREERCIEKVRDEALMVICLETKYKS
jgi:SAM-dependent methyltransferase